MSLLNFAQTTYDYSQELTNTTTDAGPIAALFGGTFLLFWLAVAVVLVIALWKVFVKAGQPGWAAIVPIYNVYILLKIAGRPGWWLLLYFIPFVNFIASLVVGGDIAKKFGKDAVWGVILCGFLGIGYLILGFDKSTYNASAELAVKI